MNRRRIPSILLAAVFALALSLSASPQGVSAGTAQSRQLIFVVADNPAVRLLDDDVDLTKSVVGLVATLQNNRPVRFVSSDSPSTVVGPFLSGDANINDIQRDVEALVQSPGDEQRRGLDVTLAQVFDFLGKEGAPQGSSVYLIGGGPPGGYYDSLAERLKPLASRFGSHGWTITGLSLPGASEDSKRMLEDVASRTGGRVLELSIPDGFKQLSDEILSQGAKGTLAALSASVLTHRDLFTSVVNVAPGTRETTLLFFKASPYGSLRLTNPSGFEVTAGDRKASFVVETPHVVLWRLEEPVPGSWKIDARRIDGAISAWEYSDNRYSLELLNTVPLSLGEPDALVAYASDGGELVVLEGVQVRAYVTTPEGAVITQGLRDDGEEADGLAGDGYFTALLPPLRAEGEHKVELEMTWLQHDHTISSQTQFNVLTYPGIEVRPDRLEDLPTGERARVASVFVHVQGEPYPVSADQISTVLESTAELRGLMELEPVRLFGGGPTWEYTLYYTPEEGGVHTVGIQLSLEYAGRAYQRGSSPLVLRSLAPPAAIAAEVEEAAPAPVAKPVTAPRTPRPITPRESSDLPWLPMALAGLVLTGLVAFIVFLVTRPGPYGYLYNDRNQPILDLATVKRHPVMGFLFRSTLRGAETKIPGLEGVVFRFSGKGISVRNLRNTPAVRVNNHPLLEEIPIEDKAWIGTHGKLYSFLVAPSDALGEATAGAD